MSAADAVFPLLLDGVPIKAIADELNIKLRTVKKYASRIYNREGITLQARDKQVMLIARHAGEIEAGQPTQVSLTSRQWKMVELVANGLTNRDIAARFGLTEHVFKNKLRPIYENIGLDTRAELAVWYYAHRHKSGMDSGERAT